MVPYSILVSGGSRGLGLAIVRHLLERGDKVATFARSATRAVEELQATYPNSFKFKACDARDNSAISSFIMEYEKENGAIQGLVNNAAVGQDNLLAHMKPAEIHDLLAINIEAPILLTRIIVRNMILKNVPGRIVNVGSICGIRGFQGLTVYSASKGAMDAFTRSLAREIGARGILVNAIAPGFFESEMSSVLAPAQLETIRRRTATGSMTSEMHILPVLDLLLFSNANITGQTFVIDGGAVA
jgi:3-oxoacyl-[acyl-carrier protein] reductase